MLKTISTKMGSMAGIGCAALGLVHLQSSALRTAPAAAVAAVGVASRSAQQIGGVVYLPQETGPVCPNAFKAAYRWLTTQAMATSNDAAKVVNEGLFDR
jgi:hypothetical protein